MIPLTQLILKFNSKLQEPFIHAMRFPEEYGLIQNAPLNKDLQRSKRFQSLGFKLPRFNCSRSVRSNSSIERFQLPVPRIREEDDLSRLLFILPRIKNSEGTVSQPYHPSMNYDKVWRWIQR